MKIRMLRMFTKVFLKDSVERSLTAAAASLVSLLGSNGSGVVDIAAFDSVKASIVAGVLMFAKCVAAARGPIGDASASMVDINK